MSQRRRNGWFSKVFKVVASVTALLAWTGHLVNVNGEVTNNNNPSLQQLPSLDADDTSNSWSALGEDVEVSVESEPFPLQKPTVDSSCDAFYMIVSTIDGKVSALDLQKKGSLVWSVQADARPLYSSSLASMEMIRNGKKMRLIPSLDGALYQFDGDKVEAIPVSAESLLSSTYKLGDDSMIVGSKDLRNYGINIRTGKVHFTCGTEGCNNFEGETEDVPLDGSNIIVLTRSTQVVRSVDVKNGNEKWNFSVGQHQVSLPSASRRSEIDEEDGDEGDGDKIEQNIPVFSSFSDECTGEEHFSDDINYENLLQLLVPEGRVVALNKGDFSQVTWEHKFDSPIAKAWLLRHGKLEAMNLFDGRNIPTLRSYIPEDMDNASIPRPLLYIGSHKKLLYIQASSQLEVILKTFTNSRVGHYIEPKVKVSWRPYPNTASTSEPIFGAGKRPRLTHGDQQPKADDKEKESTSLTVWHEDYPFDTGYFLYPEITDMRSTLERSALLLTNSPQDELEESWLPVYMWRHWKEVAFISAAMSVAVHLLLHKFGHLTKSIKSPSTETSISDASKNSDSSHCVIVSDGNSLFGDKVSSAVEFISRFATDFECLHCLGKGGFGIVFEAVNRVDDQHYAVKRTMLPRSEGAKEKVLREVRALAKLEHIGIVRYFNAWVEAPPTGWQEERDKHFYFSDTSGPTSLSAGTEPYQPAQKQPRPQFEDRGRRRRADVVDPNKRTNMSQKAGVDSLLDTDSVIFCCQDDTGDNPQLKQSGSGEFSVHADFSEVFDDSETGFTNSDSNLLSHQLKFAHENLDFNSSSFSNSKSSIPFSNYTSSSSGGLSHRAEHSLRKLSGDSVVFESSSKSQAYSNSVLLKTEISADDSIVFEKSGVTEHSVSKEISKGSFSMGYREHHTVEILSSRDGENGNEVDKPAEIVILPGTKLFLYIQMQLYRKETLKDWLSNNTLNRDRQTVLDIFDQIVCAVDYVHSQGLMHRDLKPSNIFFTADGIVKVGDFGLVTEFIVQQDEVCEIDHVSSDKHTAEVGTTLYMSPEQIGRKPYDLKVDIFSLGLIFLELWIPFSTQMERIRTLQDAKKHVFPLRFNRELPSESELVHKMTNLDPAARPFTKDILDHSLFQEFALSRVGARQRKRTISDNGNRQFSNIE